MPPARANARGKNSGEAETRDNARWATKVRSPCRKSVNEEDGAPHKCNDDSGSLAGPDCDRIGGAELGAGLLRLGDGGEHRQ